MEERRKATEKKEYAVGGKKGRKRKEGGSSW